MKTKMMIHKEKTSAQAGANHHTLVLSLFLVLTLLLGVVTLAACRQGLSAYEIAVKNGFTGSEEEWLESLKESSGNTGTTPSSGSTTPLSHRDTDTSIGEDADAAQQALRSVVSIQCTFRTTGSTGGFGYWYGSSGKTQTYESAGSGVIYALEEDGSAFIITNYHVVYDSSSNTSDHISDEIRVSLFGTSGEDASLPATYVGGSLNYDLALLRIEKNDALREAIARGSVVAATLADSDETVAGQHTLAVGNARGEGISVTEGIVSVDSEYITMLGADETTAVTFRVIRTDTAVNSGNSGGGLFDMNGHLLGIVNAKATSSGVENIGYAIPSRVVRAIADNILDYCYGKDCRTVVRGILGIAVGESRTWTAYDADSGILRRYEECQVAQAPTAGSLADGLLQEGDIIRSLTIGDRTVTVTRRYHLLDAMLDVREGDTVTIVVERDGEEKSVSMTVTADCLTAYR